MFDRVGEALLVPVVPAVNGTCPGETGDGMTTDGLGDGPFNDLGDAGAAKAGVSMS